MAEFIATAEQLVLPNQNIIFTDTTICGNNSIVHRDDSGLITLRGITNQCRARFRLTFGANIAIPEGGTVEPISVAFAINGEPVASSIMISTPAAAEEYNNVGRTIHIDVPCGCCAYVSVKNVSTQSINVQNATLVVDRTA